MNPDYIPASTLNFKPTGPYEWARVGALHVLRDTKSTQVLHMIAQTDWFGEPMFVFEGVSSTDLNVLKAMIESATHKTAGTLH